MFADVGYIYVQLIQGKLRSGYRTYHCCRKSGIASHIMNGLSSNKKIILSIDFTAWHVMQCSWHIWLHMETVTVLASYLRNRKQRVKVGNSKSDRESISKGVPQCSIMGPILFTLFLNDIVLFIKSSFTYKLCWW